MENLEFDIKLTTKELYRFTMRHTYHSISGIFSLIISVGSLITALINITKFEKTTLLVLLFIGVLFTVIQPIMLYAKCRMQIKKSESVKDELHYTVSEEGVSVTQGEQKASVRWNQIRKIVTVKGAIYLYISVMGAFIFPEEQCGEKYSEICEKVKSYYEKYKDIEDDEVDEKVTPEEGESATQESEENN